MTSVKITNCPACGADSLEHFMDVKDHSISGEVFELVRCPHCEMRITQGHPDIESIGLYYASEDYISHSDTSKGLVNNLYHRVRTYMLGQKRKLAEKHNRSAGKRLLDIGTGTGYFIDHMQTHGWEVIGLEPDVGARDVAKRNFGLDVRDISELHDLEEGTFDVITMWHVLEHVHHLNADLAQISRLLASDGILIIAVPNPMSPDARRYGEYWAAYDVPRHLWHFSPKSMSKLLTKAGFAIVDKKGMPFDAFYVSLLSEKYRGGSLGLIGGGISGLRTNTRAISNAENASSVIYVAGKAASVEESPTGR